jgi:DNA-directed RNA polymerase I subunit RPA1
MTLRINPELSPEDGEKFAKAINVLSLSEVLDEATVHERLGRGVAYAHAKIYDIHIKLFPSNEYSETYAIDIADVLYTLEHKLAPKLQSLSRKALGKRKDNKSSKSAKPAVPEVGMPAGNVEEARAEDNEPDAGEGDSDDEGGDDATNAKQKANRSQAVSYGANDEDDDRVQAQMAQEAESDDGEDEDMEDEGIGGSPSPSSDGEERRSKAGPKKRQVSSTAQERQAQVMKRCSDIVKFHVDEDNGEWCDISLEYDADSAKVLMVSVLEDALRQSLIQQIPGIGGCAYVPEERIKMPFSGKEIKVPVVHTSGVNLKAMQNYPHIINPNTISTNDIAAMLVNYGVEACRATIIQELFAVFDGHGIKVDNRHLNLIADFMTRGGGFIGFNRNGLRGSVSPFMKMSFETTVGFLADAVTDGDWDDLTNPSSRIVVGRMSKVGTGAFDVLTRVPTSA